VSAAQEHRAEEEADELKALLGPGREEELKTFLQLLHPADVADLIREVDEHTSLAILRHLNPARAGVLLSELEPAEAEQILSLTRPHEIASIVSEMESDDVADLLQELPEQVAQDVLQQLPKEEREDVTELLQYDPETAGGIMQTELVSVAEGSTMQQALDAVRAKADDVDVLSLFVVDDKGRYLGNVALQDLVFAKPQKKVEEVMKPKIVDVRTDMDQEEVARLFDKYSLVEAGVVDRVGRLRGRITADDVHEVLVEEADEDMMAIAGAGAPEDVYSGRVWKIAQVRLPWLFATFLGGLVATWILNAAAVVFGTLVVLLTFVPVITGMSGNVGSQSAMIMIRGLAGGQIQEDDVRKNIGRDFLVGLIIALTCAILVTAIVSLWHGGLFLGLCVGTALGLSMLIANILGSVQPVVLRRLGVDPAIAAGPLITSLNDITGVAIYAAVAGMFLSYLR
jgi:magnesium transporter